VINFRYHLVSLVAVFLALAVGVVVGAALNGPVLAGLKGQVSDLERSSSALRQDNQVLRGQLRSGDSFAAGIAPQAVSGRLAGRSVVIVAGADVAGPLEDAVRTMLLRSGATVTGQLQLTAGYSDPQRAAELRSYVTGDSMPAGFRLPESEDVSVLGSALLSYLLLGQGHARPDARDVTQVVTGLATLRMVYLDSRGIAPADCAVLVVAGQPSGPDAASRLQAMTDLASALARGGHGAVVVGDRAAAGSGGVLGRIRADRRLAATVSTVDGVDSAAGQVAMVYALAGRAAGNAGKAGQYGTAGNAQAVLPGISR
jgi:hypothetical protein